MIPFRQQQKPTSRTRGWDLLAWIGGSFSLLIASVLLISYLDTPTLDPLKSPELKELKARLRENPTDEGLKKQIRDLDLRLRAKYFQLLSRTGSGAYFMGGGVVIFLIACYRRAAICKTLPMPKRNSDSSLSAVKTAAQSRWSVAAVGTLGGAFLLLVTLTISSPLPSNSADVVKLLDPGSSANTRPDAANAEELARNWPRFRGPGGAGISLATNFLVSWDAKTGAGIAWKTPVLGKGFNSPLVWNNRVLYSGGDAAIREVFCHDLASGSLLWRRAITNVPGSPTQPPEVPDSTGYCAGSMATDGRRVYVIFANGDVAALSLEGQPVWAKGFGPLKNPYGHATSLATWNDQLVLQLDQGELEDRKSRLYLLDGKTGQIVWQKERKTGSSWATPIVIDAAGKHQIITLSVPAVIAYSAADGAELWKAELLSGEITPSPIFAAGQVIVASPSDKLVAIRPDGSGDVSKTHISWTNEDNVPDISSPVSNGDLVFTVTTGGMMTCVDAKTGKKVWEHDFEVECHASPEIVGHNVLVLGQKGAVFIVEAAREFKQVFKTEMPDIFSASPALAYDKMVLRGATNLWCIGRK